MQLLIVRSIFYHYVGEHRTTDATVVGGILERFDASYATCASSRDTVSHKYVS
jgi:hypothetical protein